MIELHVHSPAVPSIDLLDLPGLKSSPGPEDAPDMPQQVEALVLATQRFITGRQTAAPLTEAEARCGTVCTRVQAGPRRALRTRHQRRIRLHLLRKRMRRL